MAFAEGNLLPVRDHCSQLNYVSWWVEDYDGNRIGKAVVVFLAVTLCFWVAINSGSIDYSRMLTRPAIEDSKRFERGLKEV